MQKLLPICLIIFFLHEKATAQCNAQFGAYVQGANANFHAFDSSITNYHIWRFGDGTLAQGPGNNASHTYSRPGTYHVTHIIIDTVRNCGDSSQKTITISFADTCRSSFVVTRDTFQLNEYHFVSTSNSPPGDPIQSWQWTLNGSAVSTSPIFSAELPQGTSLVCLTIITGSGCNDITCDSVIVDTTIGCNLQASFIANALPANRKRISFVPSPFGPGFLYQWVFGDGQFSNSAMPIHTYAKEGSYNVTLIVSDSANICFDSVTKKIVVSRNHIDTLPPIGDSTITIASYPNPVESNDVMVALQLNEPAKVKVNVYNSFGNRVFTSERNHSAGLNRITIPATGLQRGQYFVDIQYGNVRRRSVFQKL